MNHSNLVIRTDEGLTFEMSALQLFTVANLSLLSTQLIILNYPVVISHRHSSMVFSSETYPYYGEVGYINRYSLNFIK